MNDLREGVVHFLLGDVVGMIFRYFSFELAPFLLGPAELLGRRGEVKEVNGNDVGSRPQIGVTYKGIELAAGFRQPRVDGSESLLLLFGVGVSAGSSQAYSLGACVLYGRYARC